MNYFLALVFAGICAGISYSMLDEGTTSRFRIFKRTDTEETASSTKLKNYQKIVLTILIAAISFTVALKLLLDTTDKINISKMVIALFCLCGAACFDYRERRIPNIFPLVLSGSGILCLALGYFSSQDGAVSYVMSSVFATVGCAVCLTAASALTAHGIGAGDIKLLSALALIGGVYTICGTLFFSVFICAAVAVFFLISKRKTLKGSLPFGPFIFIGYVITIFASIY